MGSVWSLLDEKAAPTSVQGARSALPTSTMELIRS
jgi:hypothetical protein